MSTISIHNLNINIEKKIKKIAQKKNQSVNRTIKELLVERLDAPPVKNKNSKRFTKYFGMWSEEDLKELNDATEDLNRIDPEDWK